MRDANSYFSTESFSPLLESKSFVCAFKIQYIALYTVENKITKITKMQLHLLRRLNHNHLNLLVVFAIASSIGVIVSSAPSNNGNDLIYF